MRAVVAAGTLLVACGGAESPGPAPAVPKPLAIVVAAPSAAPAPAVAPVREAFAAAPIVSIATPTKEELTAWIKAVPATPVAAPVGAAVWAAIETGEHVRVEPFRVTAIAGNTATLEDADRKVIASVPGALIHAARDRVGVKAGDFVTYFDWRHDVGLGVLGKRDIWSPSRMTVRYRDSLNVVREEGTQLQEPIPNGVAPMAWVSFPLRGGVHRGLVFAVDRERVFVRDDARHGWVVAMSDVKPLALSAKPRAVGDHVTANLGALGYLPGVVEKVFTPGFAYAVKLAAEQGARPLVVTDLVD